MEHSITGITEAIVFGGREETKHTKGTDHNGERKELGWHISFNKAPQVILIWPLAWSLDFSNI